MAGENVGNADIGALQSGGAAANRGVADIGALQAAASGVTLLPDPAVLTLVAAEPQIEIALNPAPVAMPIVAPEPTIEITLNPAAVAIPLVAPVPTIKIKLSPDPVQMPLIAPAPTILLTLNPDPAVVTFVAPDPQIAIALNPDPAVITLVAPNVDMGGGLTLTPDPAVITLVAPDPQIEIALNPDPAEIALIAPSVVITGTGHYRLFRGTDGGGRASIDWTVVVDTVPAGTGQIDIAQADNTDFWYGLAAVSDLAVESTAKRVLHCKIESGTLAGPKPNAMIFARVERTAAGKIKYQLQYAAAGAAGQATKIEFAECTGPGGAGADWTSPIDTITISGDAYISGTLTPTWADAETVHLACRAVTAAGDAGEVTVPEGSPVVADTTGPEAGEYIEVSQA